MAEMPNLPYSVLIVGGGMYVTGRNAHGYRGTLGPAVMEAVRAGLVGRIGVLTTRLETAIQACAELSVLAGEMAVEVPIEALSGSLDQVMAQFRPDAAMVSVPDHLHAAVVVPLVRAGIHCLVVKPMADTLEAAQAMTRAAAEGQVIAQVEFHKRLDESNLVLRDVIAKGELGQLQYAVIEYSQKKLVPREAFRAWATNSNIFQYLGVHYVDLLQWATGFMPVRVTAWGQKDYLADLGLDTWDSMQVVVEWDRPQGGRFVSTHITNWIDPNEKTAMSDQSINVVGTKGRYQADQKRRGIDLVTDGAGSRHLNPYFTQAYVDPLTQSLRFDGYGIKSVTQFLGDVAALRLGRITVEALARVRPSFEQCQISTAVLEAALSSLRQCSIPVEVMN